MTVEFLFLLSPNNSGSTVIAQYLAQQTGGYLPPFANNEGQSAPGIREALRAGQWDPNHAVDWPRIRQAWTALARDAGKSLFIECSPPNLMRIDAIHQAFGPGARFLHSIASPYVYVASTLFNYATPRPGPRPLSDARINTSVTNWALRAERIRQSTLAHPDWPLITYERFCADPGVANRALDIPPRPVEPIAGKRNDPITAITDLSARHHAFLTFSEWDRVNALLEEHRPLVETFGYSLRPGRALIADSARDPVQFHAGLVRRAHWAAGHKRPSKTGSDAG